MLSSTLKNLEQVTAKSDIVDMVWLLETGLASRSKIDRTLTLKYFFSSTPTPTQFFFLLDSDSRLRQRVKF